MKPLTVVLLASALVGTFGATGLEAAEISRASGPSGIDVIHINGPIEAGDDQRFRDVAGSSSKAIVLLNSEGGRVLPALEMGLQISSRGFATAVPTDGLCASACALMWLAGAPRYSAINASIGFHAAYIEQNGEMSETGSGNALIGAYLNRLGLSTEAIVFVTSAPPEGMEWLTKEKAKAVQIRYEVLSDDLRPAAQPGEVESPSDPMGIAYAFYGALSVADGERASALVVPDKRGRGPFNEQSIRKFFGAMLEPLKLREIKMIDDATVMVRYSYRTTSGQICDGRATVRTVKQFARLFIQGIKALDGC
jgi:hypothetical protein